MKNWAKREGSGGEASTSRTRQNKHWVQISSVQFTHSVVSDTLRPHGLQHARLPIPSPTPRAYSNSSPSSWWCHPIFSSCVLPFSSCLQSFPASGSFPMSQLFASGGQSIDWRFSISPSNEYAGLISFRIDWFDLLAVQGTLKSLLQHHSSNASILWHSAFFMVQFSHLYMTTGNKVMSLLFNMLSRWSELFFQVSFNFMGTVTICDDFGAQGNKVCHCFHCFPIYLPWSDGTKCHDFFFFLNVEF